MDSVAITYRSLAFVLVMAADRIGLVKLLTQPIMRRDFATRMDQGISFYHQNGIETEYDEVNQCLMRTI
jgi:hypothetical protein